MISWGFHQHTQPFNKDLTSKNGGIIGISSATTSLRRHDVCPQNGRTFEAGELLQFIIRNIQKHGQGMDRIYIYISYNYIYIYIIIIYIIIIYKWMIYGQNIKDIHNDIQIYRIEYRDKLLINIGQTARPSQCHETGNQRVTLRQWNMACWKMLHLLQDGDSSHLVSGL